MKRLVFALIMLCAGMAAQAQTIHVDHHFWDGYSLYTVKEIRMGKYFYMTTSQGDELTLEKVDGKQGEYKLIPSRQAEECPFGAQYGWRVQHITQEGQSLLAVRKPDGDVMWVLDQTTKDEEKCEYLQQMMGQEEPWNAVNSILLNRAYLRSNVATNAELRLLRNKILAYHGYRFQSKDLQEHFGKMAWYKPVDDNSTIKLDIIEQINIQLIKSEETEREEAVVDQVNAVFDYWNELRESNDEKKPSVDERFGTKEWQQVREDAWAVDKDCECGGFFDFGDEGPLDPWVYDCYEGTVSANDIKAKILPNGTAEVKFLVKDAVTTKGIPMRWLMRKEDGEWRVANIIFENDGGIDLLESLRNYGLTGFINKLYAAAAKNEADIDQHYACHVWRKMVAAVEEKDSHVAEIGFFNEDYWTQMQDSNPDDLEVRDLKIEQVDVEQGRATVSFLLHSSVQDVRQKFELCHEDGNWRVHNIIRYYNGPDGKEEESNLLEAMRSYLVEE